MAFMEIFTNFITYSIFQNEIWRYLVFIIFLIITYPVGKLISYITNHYFLKWAQKTDFKFDDILIRSLTPSTNMFVLAGLFYFGSKYINQGVLQPLFTKIFNFLLIIPIVYFLIKFSTEIISYYLKGGDSKNRRINEAGIDLLMQITKITLFIIGILLILGNLGYNVSALLAGLGIGGLAFALAAQDILKNFFAGIALVFDKTFNKGERIKFGQYSGVIEELKLRSTKLRTFDGTLVTIPNANLANSEVENVTKVPKIKVSMILNVTYDTSSKKLKQAKQIIENAIRAEEKTDKEKFWVWFENFGPSSLDIHIIYFQSLTMDDWPERAFVKERINFAIKDGFEKAKIEFAFPTQTIEIKK